MDVVGRISTDEGKNEKTPWKEEKMDLCGCPERTMRKREGKEGGEDHRRRQVDYANQREGREGVYSQASNGDFDSNPRFSKLPETKEILNHENVVDFL